MSRSILGALLTLALLAILLDALSARWGLFTAVVLLGCGVSIALAATAIVACSAGDLQ